MTVLAKERILSKFDKPIFFLNTAVTKFLNEAYLTEPSNTNLVYGTSCDAYTSQRLVEPLARKTGRSIPTLSTMNKKNIPHGNIRSHT